MPQYFIQLPSKVKKKINAALSVHEGRARWETNNLILSEQLARLSELLTRRTRSSVCHLHFVVHDGEEGLFSEAASLLVNTSASVCHLEAFFPPQTLDMSFLCLAPRFSPDSHPGDGGRPDDRPPLLLWLPHVVLVILQILKQQRGHRLETISRDAPRPIRRRLGDSPVPAGRRRWPPAPRRSSRIPRLSSYLRRWEDAECGRCLMNISRPLFFLNLTSCRRSEYTRRAVELARYPTLIAFITTENKHR